MVGIGHKLIYLRERAGLTTSQLAKKLGMSRGYLWQLENEYRKSPASDLLYQMSQELGVSMEWFYETHEHCSRCGNRLDAEVHYLSKRLPYLCGPCFEEGELLLSVQADLINKWIKKGTERSKAL